MHQYTEQDIEKVLKNVLQPQLTSLVLIEPYTWHAKFNSSNSLESISDKLDDLYESGLFEITNYGHVYQIAFDQSVLEWTQWKRLGQLIQESNSDTIQFNDAEIKRWTTIYNWQPAKYHQGFFKSIHNKMLKDKQLSKKQWQNFKYLLDYGRSMHEAGLLSTKN